MLFKNIFCYHVLESNLVLLSFMRKNSGTIIINIRKKVLKGIIYIFIRRELRKIFVKFCETQVECMRAIFLVISKKAL